MATPKPKPTVLRGKAAVDAYQKSITPKGVASADAAAKKALEERYPGMFIPQTLLSTFEPPLSSLARLHSQPVPSTTAQLPQRVRLASRCRLDSTWQSHLPTPHALASQVRVGRCLAAAFATCHFF